MRNTLDNNTIYYTIVAKNELNIKYKTKSNREVESLQGEYVLNSMLKKLNIPKKTIDKSEMGKPFFKDCNIFFNYSHSKDYIACAIANVNIGIDIEQKDRVINDVMVKQCRFNEDTKLEEYVSREAFCKYTGKGLNAFFKSNTFKNSNNIIIDDANYICSIYSEYLNPILKFISIK